jgi:hypothetical protein
MLNEVGTEDFGGFVAVIIRDDITGNAYSGMLKSGAALLAWIESHTEVKSWRVKGTMAARLGSVRRNDGQTMMRYFEDSYTSAQFVEQLRLSGQI